MKCKTCKFWKQTTNYENVLNEGVCSELPKKITTNLVLGWDGGYVESIETEEDFGCNLHQQDLSEELEALKNFWIKYAPYDGSLKACQHARANNFKSISLADMVHLYRALFDTEKIACYSYEDTKALLDRMNNGESIDVAEELAKLTPINYVEVTK